MVRSALLVIGDKHQEDQAHSMYTQKQQSRTNGANKTIEKSSFSPGVRIVEEIQIQHEAFLSAPAGLTA